MKKLLAAITAISMLSCTTTRTVYTKATIITGNDTFYFYQAQKLLIKKDTAYLLKKMPATIKTKLK